MAVYKNTASQKIAVYAYDVTTGAAKTGDAANITGYISKDWGAAAAITDTNPAELDATMPGWYVFDLTQAETNAEVIVVAPKSATANVVLDQVQIVTADSLVATAAALTTHDGKLDTVDGIVDAILVDTNELQTNQSNWLTATGFSTHSAADVWAVATRVLTANTNLNDPTAAAIADAVWDEQKAGHVAAGSFGEDVQAHALTTDIPTAAANADAVWDEQKAGHNAAGSFGEDVQAHALTTEVTALNDIAAADVVTALQTMVVDGSITWIESLRIWLAFMAGESGGGGTTNPIFYGQDGTTARISATVTAEGNRTAVTLDGSE